jgi:hypothetical protein
VVLAQVSGEVLLLGTALEVIAVEAFVGPRVVFVVLAVGGGGGSVSCFGFKGGRGEGGGQGWKGRAPEKKMGGGERTGVGMQA